MPTRTSTAGWWPTFSIGRCSSKRDRPR
jgi:hypothetical protein